MCAAVPTKMGAVGIALIFSLQSCAYAFTFAPVHKSSGLCDAGGSPSCSSRFGMRPNGRVTTLLTGKDRDEGGGEGVVDYSADPITAFLGNFLPKQEDGGDKSPKAEDLVG